VRAYKALHLPVRLLLREVPENDEKKMTREVIFRFLDDCAEIGVKAVSFIGDGESTCSPYLYDAILRGKANGLDMALGTNGYLLKDDRLEEILPCLTYLRFNISAGTPSAYAKVMDAMKNAIQGDKDHQGMRQD